MSVHPVVVGVDGSEQVRHAVRWGAREAQLRRQPLRLIATHPGLADDSGFFAGRPDVLADQRESAVIALAQAQTLAEVALGDSATVQVHAELVEGMPIPTLLRAARSATMLVVGSRGLSALSANLIGSVTYAMVGHAACPVVVIPKVTWSPVLREDRAVAVGVDGSPTSELAVAIAFAESDSGVLTWSRCTPTPTWPSSIQTSPMTKQESCPPRAKCSASAWPGGRSATRASPCGGSPSTTAPPGPCTGGRRPRSSWWSAAEDAAGSPA